MEEGGMRGWKDLYFNLGIDLEYSILFWSTEHDYSLLLGEIWTETEICSLPIPGTVQKGIIKNKMPIATVTSVYSRTCTPVVV